MTMPELIKAIATKTNYRHEDIKNFITAFSEVMIDAATNSDSISIPGLFSMEVKERAARVYYDVVNAKKIDRPPRKVVVMKTGKFLKEIGKE